MYCTPMHLFVDKLLWNDKRIFSVIVKSYQNYTPGDDYDCALKSVPCDSRIIKSLTFSEDYDQFVRWFDMLVSFTAMTIMTLAGFLGNAFNIIVFSTNKIANESTNFLLLAISVSDLFSCFVQSSLLIIFYLCFFDVSAALSGYVIMASYVFRTNKWLNLLSLDFIAFLAVQRAGAVLVPFKASVIFSYRKTKIVVSVLGIIFIGTLLPIIVCASPIRVFHPYFNKPISLHIEYNFGFSYELILEYLLQYSSNRFIVDLCITIFFVSVTVVKLKFQSKDRASLQATKTGEKSKPVSSTREQKAMKMSLAVCFATFAVYVSQTIVMLLVVPAIPNLFASPMYAVVFLTGKIFVFFSCSFNFFLYLVMSTPFRTAFKNLFKFKGRR